ncbi:MAG: hypothetical protein J5511_00270 [Bacilli bacterium]|nr:hypothetical protein [Bacilli bacterium]
MAEEKKNSSGLFKNLTIIFTSIFCFAAAAAGIVKAIMAISKVKSPQTWTEFWIYIAVAVAYLIWLVIYLAFVGMNKKVWVLGILNILFTIIGGIFFIFWKPDPLHNPGFLEEEQKNKKDNSFDKVLGVTDAE